MITDMQPKRINDEVGSLIGFYVNGADFYTVSESDLNALIRLGLVDMVDGQYVPSAYGLGLPVKRGRRRVYQSATERQAAYLERHQLEQVTVTLPKDVRDALAAYMERQARDGAALTQSEVITKLLRTQLLRKR